MDKSNACNVTGRGDTAKRVVEAAGWVCVHSGEWSRSNPIDDAVFCHPQTGRIFTVSAVAPTRERARVVIWERAFDELKRETLDTQRVLRAQVEKDRIARELEVF